MHIQYETKSLYCGVQEEEEMSNLDAQRHYRINETSIRRWKKIKEYMAQRVMLCGGTVIRNCQMMTLVTPRA
jgi:hypothetical protein